MRVVDCMPVRDQTVDIVRMVEGVRGRVPMRMDFVVRFDYGNVVPWVHAEGGSIRIIAGPAALCLTTPVRLEGRDFRHVAEFTVAEGEHVPFVLAGYPSYEQPPPRIDADEAITRTTRFWRSWSAQSTYHGEWADEVQRSLITLKALTYAPTGGIVAAPTTSLPERIGGVRNWDYRYCWLRDATFTLYSLMGAGYTDEASRLPRLAAARGRRRSRPPADHVRAGGRATPQRVRGRLAAGLRGRRRRYGSATPRTSSSSSTCTARCWTRCTRRRCMGIERGPQRLGRAAGAPRLPRVRAGASPTRASGRCAARGATSRTRR